MSALRRLSIAALALCHLACSRDPAGDRSAASSGSASAAAPAQAEAAWMSERAAQIMVDVLRSVGLEAAQRGGTVSAAGRRIDIDASVAEKAQQGDQHIVAVDFRVSIDGAPVPALRAGAIGIDPTPEGARKTAVVEWGAQYGAPLGYAIARWLGAAGPPQAGDGGAAHFLQVRVGGETLHHGPAGTRGDPGDPRVLSSTDFIQSLAARAVPLMGPRDRFRSATIQLALNGSAVTDGECRVNGDVSPALLAELKKVEWPKGNARFMYKLFFVAAPARE